ncbi:MAG: flagellar hook-basal body complex protein FliE [Planctomycetes bacterium]|nr:flagellar hook-basal body complex protein FliE [Planctomycetota bacterium]
MRAAGIGGPGPAQPAAASGGFVEKLGEALEQVNSAQQQADQAVQDLASGKVEDVHDVMLAMTEADLSFRLMLEVRNKLVEAYQEVSRMQV